ncbi:MAG: PEP-CTERM sorting domain-containing protein [Verrucomicrobiota bacterium]
MKTQVIFALLVASPSFSFGASLILGISNLSPVAILVEPDGAAFLPNGTPLTVGTYSDFGAINPTNFAGATNGFIPFATTTVDLAGSPGGFISDNLVLDDSITAIGDNIGAQLAVVVGDNTGWAVITNPTWIADGFAAPPIPSPTIGLLLGDPSNNFIAGNLVPDGFEFPTLGQFVDAIVLVPEPSSLGFLAMSLIFLRFRRRVDADGVNDR